MVLLSNSSFRDPSGFVFQENGRIFRQINSCYFEIYQALKKQNIFEELFAKGLLIEHKEVECSAEKIVLEVKKLPFVSYPYEWSFSQLKDAALLTLELQKFLICKNFSLKDASVYNIQFIEGKPIFIDTLSIEPYQEKPWIAFGQFCRHFLYPLMLMSKIDLRLNNLLKLWIDGIPGDIVDGLLPFSKKFSLDYWFYVKWLNTAQTKNQSSHKKITPKLSKKQLERLLDGLFGAINKLVPAKKSTEWGEYYTFTNYTDSAFSIKEKLVQNLIEEIQPKVVWDLGANDGRFSRLASRQGITTLAFDIDPIAVEKNYQFSKKNNEKHILSLLLDLTNPSSGIGWANQERFSLTERANADLCMALALVHHLAIGNNVPFEKIAEYFSSLGNNLIIEFIPKEDSKVQELLLNREDVFENYKQFNFEESFSKYFTIERMLPIDDSLRTLYWMKKK